MLWYVDKKHYHFLIYKKGSFIGASSVKFFLLMSTHL